ncbi:M16 family metallopeptidase [Aliiroseovarius sp. PTFE2010]|uniref:M16 family metallopeptidase n=1 Tax=Aliiroseovarius sp. PTFE2010 TaxID=3417190 RepID=UPI003CED126D
MIRLMIAIGVMLITALPLRAEIAIQDVTTPGGIKAWLVEEHSLPFVALEMRFKGGASLDPEGKRGAATLMVSLLEEGTGDMDARAFAEATESIAASFGFDASNDGISVSARFLTETRDEAVDLLNAALTAPNFDDLAVERVRAQLISSIQASLTDPGDILSRKVAAMTWGDHPYGSSSDGTIASVSALTRDDLIASHRATLAKDRVYVSAVGDITAQELGQLIDELLGSLPDEGAPLIGQATYQAEPGVTVVPYETPQSVVRFGHRGIAETDPDFLTAYVLNEIFGGGTDSRLHSEVREKRGLTYGIGTWLASRPYGDTLGGQFATGNARVGEAIEVIETEWAKISENGISQQELDDAKKYLTGAYPLRFDSNAAIANILASMQFRGQTKDYVIDRNDRVNAITLDEINRVAARLYRPEDLFFVIVGQPEGLSEPPAN